MDAALPSRVGPSELTTSVGVPAFTSRVLRSLLLIAVLLHAQVRSQTPAQVDAPITITHNIGQDAELTCTVKDLGRRRVIWSKLSDPYPISVGTTRFTTNRKYKISLKSDNSYVLTIKDVNLLDAGEYQCRASGQEYLAEIVTLNIKAGADSTHLIPTENTILAQVGSTALLPCQVENLNDRLVLWKGENNEVISLRKKIFNGNRRLSIIHDTAPEWSLEIKDITMKDFGHYTCVINSRPVLTRTVTLKNSAPVESSPVLMIDTNYRMKVEADAGETVTLTCNFRANPPATVTWYRRNPDNPKEKENMGKGNSLTLESVRPEQSAQYVCVGRNGLKPSARGKTKLTVKAPPTTATTTTETTSFVPTGPTAPRLYQHQPRYEHQPGTNAEIRCIAIGQPRPNVHWKRHSYRLTDGRKYKTTSERSGRHKITSTLLVRSLSSRDFGQYECVGYNQLGMHSLPIEIHEIKLRT